MNWNSKWRSSAPTLLGGGGDWKQNQHILMKLWTKGFDMSWIRIWKSLMVWQPLKLFTLVIFEMGASHLKKITKSKTVPIKRTWEAFVGSLKGLQLTKKKENKNKAINYLYIITYILNSFQSFYFGKITAERQKFKFIYNIMWPLKF